MLDQASDLQLLGTEHGCDSRVLSRATRASLEDLKGAWPLCSEGRGLRGFVGCQLTHLKVLSTEAAAD